MKSTISFCLAVLASVVSAGERRFNLAEQPPKGGRFKTPADLVWPANPGEGDVCLWADDRMAALSITIDDNCAPDHQWWLERAEEFDLPLTWFLITGKVGGRNAGFDGTWDKYRELADAGHSIQSHTTDHNSNHNAGRQLTEEELVPMYRDSQSAVNGEISGRKCLALAYPRGECNRDVAARFYIAARGTVGVPNSANAIDYMCTNLGGISRAAVEMILDGHTELGPKWLGPKAYLKRGWTVGLYHLVAHGKTPEEQAEGRAKAYEELKYVGERRAELWCGTFVDVAKYGQERDTAKLAVESADASKIVFSLTDDMKDDVFDYPLTVKFRLPDDWTDVKAVQGGKPVKAEFIRHDGAPYALVHAVPDRGATELTR